jgi:hypothetical protein
MRFLVTWSPCAWVAALASLIATPLVAACGETEELDCTAVDYVTCDIRMDVCQKLVFDQMRCLRGDEGVDVRPRSRVVAAEELRESFQSDFTETEVDPDVERTYAALAVIEMVDPADTSLDSQVEFQVEGLLGFYSHVTKEIVIVDHGEPLDDELATTTLGHEYVHALQDMEFDLSAYREKNSFSYDAVLASTSVTEGEATLYDGFQLAKIGGDEPARVDWLEYYSHFAAAANDYAVNERSPLLVAGAVFPYTYGPLASARDFADQGRKGLERARGRDLSTQSFMARPSSEPTFAPEGPFDELALGAVTGRRSLGSESLGAWLLHSFAIRSLGNPPEPDLALSWRGDALSVFHDSETDASELVWTIRWKNDVRAQEFVDGVAATEASREGSMIAFVDGDTSVIVASTLLDADLAPYLEALDATLEVADATTEAEATPPATAPDSTSALARALGRFAQACHH